MDGTLTISTLDFNYIRSELGLLPKAPILEALQAMPAHQSAPLWKKLYQLEADCAEDALIMRGALNLLEQLRARGAQLALVTRNTMAVVERTLDICGLDAFFPLHHRLDRDSCAPKPAPDGILQLLKLWQIEPVDAVMVGDHLFDLQAGRRAGVTTIHLDAESDAPSECSDIKVRCLTEINALI